MYRPSAFRLSRSLPWLAAWCALVLAGAAWIAHADLQRMRDAFDTDARIVHRLLSQRAVEHEAVLATLALLEPAALGRPEQRLPAIYARILTVQRRDGEGAWAVPALQAAEAVSRRSGVAAVADTGFGRGSYWLVLAGEPASYALQLDLQAMVPRADWPLAADGPVRVELRHGTGSWMLQPGQGGEQGGGWRFEAVKTLAAASQPFELVCARRVGWGELPWPRMAAWALAAAVALAGLAIAVRQRAERRRAEERLRLDRVSRLNALGELAAGMAHELNQPLTAVLANARAADRLLAEEPPELDTARAAMSQAVAQARRAAEVLARLRRTVERPERGGEGRRLGLAEAAGAALHLVEPECRGRQVTVHTRLDAGVTVIADPVALEQILHNLLMNALQAMEQVPAAHRTLTLTVDADGAVGVLRVADSGPGIAAELLPRIFQPFFTTRSGGLGLGLSLCETLAAGMGGSLVVETGDGPGAVFRLTLPLSTAP